MNKVIDLKKNIDMTLVVSAVVASIVIGAVVLVARKAGLGGGAQVVKGG